ELSPHPVDGPRHYRGRVEGRAQRLQRDQGVANRLHRGLVVATADGTAGQEPPIFVIPDDQRVEWPLARPSDDHEVVGLDGFDLEPEWAALAWHVGTLLVLGD